jgi:hypothetical protein
MRISALLASGLVLAGTAVAAQRGPAPASLHMDAEVLALACAPSLAYEAPLADLQVTGGQDSVARRRYSPGDLITINAGTDNGIEVGQEFYTRRVQLDSRRPVSRRAPGVVRTTGWIKVYAVDTKMSLATITHACETVDVGDFLEPFALPTLPPVDAELAPAQRDNYGRILVGDERRRTFATGDFMIVDRGSDHGVTVGSRFVVYRDKHQAKNFLYDLGEAIAVDVRPETSTLQVTVSRDAFMAGDYVAIRKQAVGGEQ